jgi:dipeptidyl-peptidase-4
MHHVKNLRGKLLLIHGMIDENVHFRHTARLINHLMAERKPYEILLFPDERHMPRQLDDRIYMEERIFNFVERSL